MPKVSDVDKQVQKLAKEFSASGAKFDDLSKKVADASRQIEQFERDIAANQDVAESLTQTVEAGNAKIQTLADDLSLYRADVEKELRRLDPKNSGMSALAESVASTGERLESLKVELSRVNESIFLLRSEEKDAFEKIGQHDAGIAEIKGRLDLIAGDSIPKMSEQLESLGRNFQGWSERIQFLSNSIATISMNIEEVSRNGSNGSSEEIARQLVMINQKLEGLEKGVAQSSAKILDLQGSVASLSKKIASVEMDSAVYDALMLDQF